MTVNVRFTASVPVLVSAGLIVGVLVGALAYRSVEDLVRGSGLKTASAKAPDHTEAAALPKNSFSTDLVRVPQADDLAAALRNLGYNVNLMTDEDVEQGKVTKERYSVMVIGREVPARLATTAIRLTHQHLPWVKYIYLQFQYPEMDRHLVLNAHDGWVESLELKPASDADFARLSNPNLSTEELHAMLQKFRK
jgi:hypothetical protein